MTDQASRGGRKRSRAILRALRTTFATALLTAGCHGTALGSDGPTVAVGLNLAPIRYWYVEVPFLDRVKTGGDWQAYDAAYKYLPDARIPFDANGYPKALPAGAKMITMLFAVDPRELPMTDRYVVLYKGKATIGAVGGSVVDGSPGRIVIDFKIDKPMLGLSITAIDPADPLRDLHVIREDQLPLYRQGVIFNPVFLDKVRQFDTVRLMDWLDINPSGPVSWATRSKPDDLTWSKGVPLEIAVRLANESGANLWYNVPTLADDAYVRSMAELLKASLDPRRKLYLEYSNEVWNGGFAAASIAQKNADALWGGGQQVAQGNLLWYGYRSAQIATIANTVFAGPDRKRLINTFSAQTAVPGRESFVVTGMRRARTGEIRGLFDAFAITTYFGDHFSGATSGPQRATLIGWARGGEPGMAAAFEQLRQGGGGFAPYSLAELRTLYAYWAKFANAQGVRLIAYEGGAHMRAADFGPERDVVLDFVTRLSRDPRMGTLYTQMAQDFAAAGGSELTAYNFVGDPSVAGYFGLLGTIYQEHSPRFDALADISSRHKAAARAQ